jgi:hypothetical protein
VRGQFLLWVIGHELGHLLHHDGAAHFGQRGFEQLSNAQAQQKRELDADSFFAQQLNTDRVDTDGVAGMLFRILVAGRTCC